MKKIGVILMLMWMFVPELVAQSRLQVISDIKKTMDDFISDLSYVNEIPSAALDNISGISYNYGSADYFLYNNQQMPSFKKWLEEYCFKGLKKNYVVHSIEVLDMTVEKVDAQENRDKRYRFSSTLKRESIDSFNDEKTVNFVVEWRGKNKYVSILEIKGNLYQLLPEQPVTLEEFKALADKGDVSAMIGLAELYLKRRTQLSDYDNADFYARKALSTPHDLLIRARIIKVINTLDGLDYYDGVTKIKPSTKIFPTQ